MRSNGLKSAAHGLRRPFLRLLAAWSLVVTAGTAQDGPTNAPAALLTMRNGRPCHTAAYAPHLLDWTLAAAPQGLRTVHPHPCIAATVYAIAADGLHRSDDGAVTWRKLPLAGLADQTAITDLAFRPDEPETLAIGTRANGVWLTANGGQSVRKLGAKSSGMAANAVACLVYEPGDDQHRTLLVGHGPAATGVSRCDTRTGAWTVAAPDYFVHRILPGNPGNRALYLFASGRANPDVMGVYYANVLGAYWQRLVEDALPTDGAWSHLQQSMYFTTLDKGVLRVSAEGAALQELGGADLAWLSVAPTWDAHAEQERLCLYQPSKLGLAWTTNDLTSLIDQNHGLHRGAFVSDSSRIRPNAGGTRFYGAINGALWIGGDGSACRVDTVTITPATVTVASPALRETFWKSGEESLRQYAAAPQAGAMASRTLAVLQELNTAIPQAAVTVQARVVAPAGITPRVTADLSRLGFSPETPLAALSNGLYGLTFDLTGEALAAVTARPQSEWRRGWPDAMPITVTASLPGQLPAGAVGLFAIDTQPADIPLGRDHWALYLSESTGHVAFACERDSLKQYAKALHQRLSVGPGAWCAPIWHRNLGVNIAEYDVLTFLIRCVGPADPDLSVHVCDRPADALPTITPGVALVAGHYIAGGALTSVYRRVTVPVTDLLRNAGSFNTELFSGIAFSGESMTNRTYLIDDMRLVVYRTDLAAGTGDAP